MRLYKYCASGNDFVIFSTDEKKDRSNLAKELCNRYSGVGADGMIVLLPSKDYDFEWDFYNCDGSKASMCGNGARAAALFAVQKLGKNKNLSFLSGAGEIKASIFDDEVEILLSKAKDVRSKFSFEDKTWQGVDTGVPHLVHFCEDLKDFDIELCKKARDKFNANVNFAKVLDKENMAVRTFERGVEDETLACGTGMAACFYLAYLNKLVDKSVKILPKSKEELFLRLENDDIYFKGRVRYCFEANYNLA